MKAQAEDNPPESSVPWGLLASPGGRGNISRPLGAGDQLVTDEGTRYPVVEGVPILLPLAGLSELSQTVEAEKIRYEANEEYGRETLNLSRTALDSVSDSLNVLADPASIDSTFEYSAQVAALQEITPIEGKVVVQIGGSGLHAVKLLMAGASGALTITPFLQEALIANQLAFEYGQADRHLAVVGIGESLPVRSEQVDVLYLGGSLHHLDTALAAPEMSRVLRPGGSFVAVDPWKTAVYSMGTRVFGKRERDVSCIPMDSGRINAMTSSFDSFHYKRYHPVLRYPLILLNSRSPKKLSSQTLSRLLSLETRLEAHAPKALAGHGSSVVTIGRKSVR